MLAGSFVNRYVQYHGDLEGVGLNKDGQAVKNDSANLVKVVQSRMRLMW
jgi:hypothetical protein